MGDSVDRQIILNIRLPRVLSGMLAGTALAVSGTIMQSILRNPLGSPFTLGISNAAAFGAAFAVIILGAGSTQSSVNDSVTLNNPYIITISAFFWSLVSTLIILFMAKFKNALPETLILTGIILGSLFSGRNYCPGVFCRRSSIGIYCFLDIWRFRACFLE